MEIPDVEVILRELIQREDHLLRRRGHHGNEYLLAGFLGHQKTDAEIVQFFSSRANNCMRVTRVEM